jgi:hypothetical protein
MRTVGGLNRSSFEPDPGRAWQRARRLDTLLRAAAPAWVRGVTRGTHEAMTRQDEARMLEAARRINRR